MAAGFFLTVQQISCTIRLQPIRCMDGSEGAYNMNVHHYKTQGGKDLIINYIMSLSKPEIVDGLSVLECFEKDELDMLTIKPWQGKVWEVYFYKHRGVYNAL